MPRPTRGKEIDLFDVNPAAYRDGAEGFIRWCEELVCLPIYPPGSDIAVWVPIKDLPREPNPDTGRSYWSMWEAQKDELRRALVMEKGRFKYRLIVFCWMRGEGKSVVAVLIQLWKFFCWPRQQIMLGANSKEQTKFVHYDIMRDVILNSPRLLMQIGKRNIQEKEIRIKDERGNVRSIIRSISSFSGIVSNITGYTFSEIFDMKNPKFFTQLDGSIRNIPNALGVIDSTVSEKTHILYHLYNGWLDGTLKTVYFSYRSSKTGDVTDYWNPNMTQEQLSDYRGKFALGDFERYFLNTWSSGTRRVFSEDQIEAIGYLGMDGGVLNQKNIIEAISTKLAYRNRKEVAEEKGFTDGVEETQKKIDAVNTRFSKIQSTYTLSDKFSQASHMRLDTLNALTEKFDTHWAIIAGADMGDPMAIRSPARSVLTVLASSPKR